MTPQIPIDEIADILGVEPEDASVIAKGAGVLSSRLRRLRPADARALLERRGFRFPKRNIVFHCLKGGASKTTLAYNTAFRLAQVGARVLLVDLDKQANATHSFVTKPGAFCFVDLVTEKAKIEQAIVPVCPFLDLLPSSLENARLETELIHRQRNPQTFYRDLFSSVRDHYDFLILDLPPDLSHNTFLSTLFADLIVIPVNSDVYSLSGMRMTLESIEGIRKQFSRTDQDVLVVLSKFDAREKSALGFLSELKELGSARLLPTVIRMDITFKTAQAKAKSVFQIRRRSRAKEDMDLLVREVSGLGEYFAKAGSV